MQKSKLQINPEAIHRYRSGCYGARIQMYLLIIGAMFLPFSVFASTVYVESNHSEFFVGDTIMFNVRIDSENKNVNAVDGSVLLNYPSDLVSLIDLNTSGSDFSLWPNKPLPSDDGTSISFAGGIPGGLNSKDAIVFNIVLKLQKEGQIILTPDTIGVYLNDGKGTKDEVGVKDLIVNILPKEPNRQSVDDWGSLISDDKTPPEPFEIYLGQDRSVFDGKKFLSFNTTDKQSDIAYYEVKENDFPPTRSDNTYILQEQDKSVKVVVTAYDSAGNARESVYASKSLLDNLVVFLTPVVLLLVIALIVKLKIKYKKSK